jgi:hypothetical protein
VQGGDKELQEGFVRFNLGAVCTTQVLVQMAEEVSFLSVHVSTCSFVFAYVLGVRGRQAPEVQQRSAGDGSHVILVDSCTKLCTAVPPMHHGL